MCIYIVLSEVDHNVNTRYKGLPVQRKRAQVGGKDTNNDNNETYCRGKAHPPSSTVIVLFKINRSTIV